MKTRLFFCLLVFILGLGVQRSFAANTYDWTGATSTAWTNPLNWKYNGTQITAFTLADGYPGFYGATDIVNVGNGTSYSTNQPTLNNGALGTITIAQLSVGSSNSGTLTLTTALTVTNAITVNSNGFTFAGGGLLTGYNFVGSGNTNMNTPLTITTGDITINNPYSFTSSAVGVINGITFTGNYGNAVSFGANITLTGGTASGSTYSMTIPQGGSLINAAAATIKAPSVYLGYSITATINGPVNLSGLLYLAQSTTINSGTSGTISAGNITLYNSNTINAYASIAVTSSGTLSVGTSNINTYNTASTINTPNLVSTSSGTNTFTLLGAATVSTLLTISSGTATFTTSNSSLLSPAAVQVSGTTMNVDMPMTVSGAITTNSNSNINSNSTGVINAGSMSITGTAFNLSATSTTSGTVTFVSGTSTLTGTPLFKANAVTVSGATVNVYEPLTSTNALTLNSGSSVYGNSTGVVNAGTMSITGSTVSLQAAAKTTTGDITFVSGTNSFSNSALTTSAGNVNLQAGTLTLTSAVGVTATSNFITASGTTFNSYSAAITATALQIGGSFNLYVTENVTTTSTGYINNGITFSYQGDTLDFLGTGIITVGGTTTLSYQTYIQVGSSSSHTATLTFNAGAIVNSTSNVSNGINNYAYLNFTGTSGSGVTVSFTTQNSVLNNYSPGIVICSNTAFTFNGNTSGINNTGAFTANLSSSMAVNGYQDYIVNNAIFNAGTSGSACSITLNAQSANITNTGSSSQNAYFNLGSTSVIYLSSGYQANVTNTANGYSYFTLRSDSKGSATTGQITLNSYGNGNTGFLGTYNVQRYMTGGSALYRTYRVLSSPTNLNTNSNPVTPSSTNYIDFSNFSSTSTKNNYKVYDHLAAYSTFYGAYTGGASGFSIVNGNPTMYLYNETLNPSAATTNQNFTTGKNVGLKSISGTAITASGTTNGVTYNLGSTSIPVGNGFLLFYIGSINGRSTTNPESTLPDTAVVTNVGYINQQSILTYLWYTPGGGSSGQLSYSTAVTNYKGINMLGNPYASTIDLKKVYSDNSSSTGFTTFYELVDVNPGQAYVSYNGYTGATSSSTYSSEYVASGQGFLVLATATGQSLTFNEDQKVYNTSLLNSTSTPPVLLNAQNPDGFKSLTAGTNNALLQNNNILTGLHLKLMGDTATFDECGIYFNPAGADAYNTNDALDLDGINPKVYMSSYTSDGIRTGINTLANYTNGKRIKLYVRATTDGIYHLNLEDMANIDTTNFSVYLIDTKLNDSLDMVHYKTYDFNLTAADTAAFRTRFVLAIERKAMPPYSLVTFTGQKANTAIQLNWKTSGEGNYTGFGLEKLQPNGQYLRIDSVQSDGTGLYTFNDINPVNGSNIYRLEQNDINGKVSFAGPININYNTISVSGMFTIYPNPSKAIINVSVNSSTTGNAVTQTYVANIYDLSGSMMNTRQVNTNNWTQDVTGYKAGVYILELKTTDGNIVGKAKFVKVN